MTLSFNLTPINQSCSRAPALLYCPLRRWGSSIWNRSEQRPKREPQLRDPVGLSGSKRQAVLSSTHFYKKIIQQKQTEVQHAAGASPRLRALWEYNGICWKGRHHVDIGSVPSLLSLHVPPDRLTVPERLMSSTLSLWGISDMLGQWHHSDGSRSSFPPSISDLRRRTNSEISHSVSLNSLLNCFLFFFNFFLLQIKKWA